MSDRAGITALIAQRTGGRTPVGPFAGMRVLPDSSRGSGDLGARWLGVLVTFHGAVVHFDRELGQLRQAPIGADAASVVVAIDGDEATLWFHDGDALRPIGDCGPEGCMPGGGDAALALRVIDAGLGRLTLRGNGRYLSAELEGGVTLSRLKASHWEEFQLINPDDYAALQSVLSSQWISHADGTLITPDDMACVPGGAFRIGGMDVSAADMMAAARAAVSGQGGARVLSLTHDVWKVTALTMYRPLAYLVACGKAEIVECAKLAIDSLFEHGQWDGDVLVITDMPNRDALAPLAARWPGRLHVRVLPAHDVLDYTLARYRISELEMVRAYQPVIYIDSDVICDAPLDRLMRQIARSAGLHAVPEGSFMGEVDYYGGNLLRADGIEPDEGAVSFSSGILAFRHVDDQRLRFRAIIDSAYRFAASTDNRAPFLFDQPFMNYVSRKFGDISGQLLNGIVMTKPLGAPNLEYIAGKGLVHFAGGVGAGEPKLAQMAAYSGLLAARAAAERSAAIG